MPDICSARPRRGWNAAAKGSPRNDRPPPAEAWILPLGIDQAIFACDAVSMEVRQINVNLPGPPAERFMHDGPGRRRSSNRLPMPARPRKPRKRQADVLARIQDNLAARFGKGGGSAAQSASTQLPQKAVEAPGSAGPSGGTSPSAEAHSGDASRKHDCSTRCSPKLHGALAIAVPPSISMPSIQGARYAQEPRTLPDPACG